MFNVTPTINFHLELLFSNYSLLKSVQKLGYRKLVFHGNTKTIGIFETPQRKTCIIPSTPKQFGNRFSSTFQRWFSGRQNVGPTHLYFRFPSHVIFRFFRIQLLRPNIKDPCPSVDWCFSASSTWVQNNDFGMQPPCDPWPRQVVGLPGVPGYPAAIGRTSTGNSVWLFFKSFELWQTIFTHVYCIHFYLSIW